MRPGQNFYYAQHQQQAAQGNTSFRPGQQPQQNPGFLSPVYAGLRDLHSGVQVLTLPIGAVAQQYAVTPIPLPQQWGHLRESQGWGNGAFPSQAKPWGPLSPVLNMLPRPSPARRWIKSAHRLDTLNPKTMLDVGSPFHGQQFVHHEPNVAFIPPQHHRGDGLRGPSWGYGQDGPSGRFDRNPGHQDLRRPLEGMRHMEHLPHERGSRGSSRDKSYDDNRSGSWSNGAGPSNTRNMAGGSSNARNISGGSSNTRNMSGGRNPKGRGGGGSGGMDREQLRSQSVSLRCEPCDRTLTNAQQFAAHKSTHVKCDVKGCSFEASGRVVKEHKQTCHESSSSYAPSRPGLFKSKESEEEISRWREERKRNYPTTANIKHKAEEMQARKARGELVDEDARKRRERLKEILARQAELGVPVAELPAYYLSDRYGAPKGKGDIAGGSRKDSNRGGKRRHPEQALSASGTVNGEGGEPPLKQARMDELDFSASGEPAPSNLESEAEGEPGSKPEKPEQTGEAVPEAVGSSVGGKDSSKNSKQSCYFFRRGRCRKGNKCEFVHGPRSERPKKPRRDAAAGPTKRQPSLLYKLLEPEIRREKSHLLQSLRFLVNNKFLQEYPEKPLKFFQWTDIEEQSTSDVEVARLDRKIQEELAAVIEDTEEDEDEEDDDTLSDSGEEDRQDFHSKPPEVRDEVMETQI